MAKKVQSPIQDAICFFACFPMLGPMSCVRDVGDDHQNTIWDVGDAQKIFGMWDMNTKNIWDVGYEAVNLGCGRWGLIWDIFL